MDSVPEFEHVSCMGAWTHRFVGPQSLSRELRRMQSSAIHTAEAW